MNIKMIRKGDRKVYQVTAKNEKEAKALVQRWYNISADRLEVVESEESPFGNTTTYELAVIEQPEA